VLTKFKLFSGILNNASTKNRSFKFSPDCSGYAAWSDSFWSV